MGVTDLWKILKPACEYVEKSCLLGQTLAIDLSGWIVEFETVHEMRNVPKPYLRSVARQ